MVTITEAVWVAIIGLFSGGFGIGLIKIVEKVLGRGTEKAEIDSNFRGELRMEIDRKQNEINSLKLTLDRSEEEANGYKRKYWLLFERFFTLKTYSSTLADTVEEVATVDSFKAPHEETS